MSGYPVAVVLCVLLVALLVFLLRTRRIREKFAAVWIALAIVVTVAGAVPDIVFWLADLLGVQTPVNLIFTVAFAVVLAVCLQLSGEISSLEEETRTLAEEHALLALEVRRLTDRTEALEALTALGELEGAASVARTEQDTRP